MLSVAEARTRILEQFAPLEPETVPLAAAAGRVLAGPVQAGHDLPAFTQSSMDGYAVRWRDVAMATPTQPALVAVSQDIRAGGTWPPPLAAGTAARIMTGAPVPAGTEAVVPVEDTDEPAPRRGQEPPAVVRILKKPRLGDNIRPAGQDVRAGQTVLTAGARLTPPAIGLLAALGQAQVRMHRRPEVAILSTGDELCAVEADPAPGQKRDANGYALAAAVERCGGQVLRLGIAPDREEAVRAHLRQAVEAGVQLILSSAGVSVGAYDVVREVVRTEGALDFWRVRMRPGKPLAFGNVRGVPFIGLPGNPVSALVTFEVFVRPVLLQLGGRPGWKPPVIRAELAEPVSTDDRESYVRVTLTRRGETWVAHSAGDQGSASLAALTRAHGLLIIPEGAPAAPAGSVWPVWLLEAEEVLAYGD
jgi:molybdopterin molybdotransferase